MSMWMKEGKQGNQHNRASHEERQTLARAGEDGQIQRHPHHTQDSQTGGQPHEHSLITPEPTLKIELVPAHRLDVAPPRAGQQEREDQVANGVVATLCQRREERPQLGAVEEPISRLLFESPDPCAGLPPFHPLPAAKENIELICARTLLASYGVPEPSRTCNRAIIAWSISESRRNPQRDRCVSYLR